MHDALIDPFCSVQDVMIARKQWRRTSALEFGH